ncbi:hypothetical protein N7466_002854 [Penicillium verhagenii]|uniref:uncharacterized protein n=1 Tax=Penicillium verhagenii TaxID=1562060 RepID=UPI0025450B51|nr:uncharacterized protein N7466_002854 [Penicillium verhagenii]KAJ5939720.1 hypothetical protein N7466_002854 [Penicillium verhagenii]
MKSYSKDYGRLMGLGFWEMWYYPTLNKGNYIIIIVNLIYLVSNPSKVIDIFMILIILDY